MPLSLATVVTPVLEKVATPSGTVAGVQLFGSTHSLGSPPLPPTHVASTAWAATTPRAVEASRMASEWRPIDCKPAPRLANRQSGPVIMPLRTRSERWAQFERVEDGVRAPCWPDFPFHAIEPSLRKTSDRLMCPFGD